MIASIDMPIFMTHADRVSALERYPAMVRGLANAVVTQARHDAALRRLGLRAPGSHVRAAALLAEMESVFVRTNNAIATAIDEARRRQLLTATRHEEAKALLANVGKPMVDAVMGLGVLPLVWVALIAIIVLLIPISIAAALRLYWGKQSDLINEQAATAQAIALSERSGSMDPIIDLERSRGEVDATSTSANIARTAGYGVIIALAIAAMYIMGSRRRRK